MRPVRWGVLGGTAMIAVERVIPAMQSSPACDVLAVASRDPARAEQVAEQLGVGRAHGSYEALLADPDVEAVYVPLPNHLHVEWSLRALERGKHVLCEKPIAMSAAEAEPLIAARERTGLLVEEAFMVREHPQWQRLRELMADPRFGELRAVQLSYSYNNPDPRDIRNHLETGGGGLYDLGCYACTVARLIFDAEPVRAVALMQRDPRFGTDRLTTATLDFDSGHASFVVATQGSRYQCVQVLGTGRWIRMEVPFAHPATLPARLVIGEDVLPGTEPSETIVLSPVNQYTLQAERFSRAVRGERALSHPLESGIANMRVLDALRRSAESGRWETVGASD